MTILGIIFVLLGYVTIGAALSLAWVTESVRAAPEGEWDATTYLIKCCLKWPKLLVNKDAR